ncbi:MAG: hypothetical protein M3503_00760 [Actinomycetota bacterium]|nr:hypothetical protein [Actinomycetota bacterium]
MEIRVLGGIEVLVGGHPRHLDGRSQRLVLAVLLVHRRAVVPLDLLVDAMWGDFPPPTARATMQTHVSKLRRALAGVDAIEVRTVAPGYILDVGAGHVDADRFEIAVARARDLPAASVERIAVLDQALASWRGAAFAEFADDPWARGEAARLEELRLVAVEERVDARMAVGGHADVVGELGSLLEQHPFRERLWGQLMLALHRSGRQGEALRAANLLRCRLREDLGLEPSPELRDLERAIAADDLRLRLPAARETAEDARPPRRTAHLPAAATELVGRREDLIELSGLLPATRLLTLAGPGGVGKSSLAVALAHREQALDRSSVRFVELASVRDETAVAAAAAEVLDIERRPGRSLEESIIDVLRSREMLLVLDNCEHVLDAVGRLVHQLIRWCPDVRVLTTSREPIGMAGEVVWPVLPLEVPSTHDATPDDVARSPAVQVFVARAREVVPAFRLTDAEAPAIAELCIQLDGVPLALELAAARMASMSPGQLADRLHERFVLLGGGHARDPRHRTLVDLVQWSYELLSPTEQSLFDRLSVFVGGFDLGSAEEACGVGGFTPGEVATPLAHLVEKSLVVADPGRRRYRQLETLRQYGAERLATRPEESLVRRSHVATFVTLAERAGAAMETPAEQVIAAQLDVEFGNLRAAVSTALDVGDADSALRLVAATHEWAFRRIRYEIVEWAERAVALDAARDHPLLPTAMAVVGYGRFVRGELARAVALAEDAIEAGGRLAVPSHGLAERVIGNALFYRGEQTEALRWMDRMVDAAFASGVDGRVAHALYMRSVAQTSVGDAVGGASIAAEATSAAGDAGSGTAEAQALYATALAAAGGGDEVDAVALLLRSAEVAGAAGNRWMRAFAMTEAMWLTARRGDMHRALTGYGEVVEIWYRGGDWANQWLSLRQLAGTLASVGRDEEAALILGAVDAAGATTALPFAPSDADDLQRIARELRHRLGPDAMERARHHGRTMRDDMVVNVALDAVIEASESL